MIFIIPFIFGAIGLAVGAVGGAFAAHASSEEDRQKASHHRKVANELNDKYSDLQKRYYELGDQSKSRINDFKRKLAISEVEKDVLHLVVELQQGLIALMFEIENNPTPQALSEFEKAVLVTNTFLFELKKEFIQVPNEYFPCNLKLANEKVPDNRKISLTGNVYPTIQCKKCGQKNRITPHSLRFNFNPACGKCQTSLVANGDPEENLKKMSRRRLKKEGSPKRVRIE